MDRRIEVKVFGNHLWKDGNRAGVQGEGNVTTLRISFDEGWSGYAKRVTFFNAKGRNPVTRILTADLLENAAESTLVYLCKIPPEPLAEAGWCSFIVDGYIEDERQRSVETQLEVVPARETTGAVDPGAPTPTQAEQLQTQIEAVMEDVQKAAEGAQNAELAGQYAFEARASAESALESKETAVTSAASASESAVRAEQTLSQMGDDAETAARSAAEAQQSASAAAESAAAAGDYKSAAEEAASIAEEAKNTTEFMMNAVSGDVDAIGTFAQNAEQYMNEAKEAKDKAEYAGDNAWASYEAAVEAQRASVSANSGAREAAGEAQAAQKAAESAKSGAESAATRAEAAQAAAERAAENAQQAAGSGDMQMSVYDPAGLKKDIFLYIGEMAAETLTDAQAYADELLEGASGSGGAGVFECYLDQTEFWEVNDAYQNGSIVVMWDNCELWPMVYADTDNEYRFRIVDPDGIRTAYLTEDGWSNSYDAFSTGGSTYAMARIGEVSLPASAWASNGNLHSQVVEIDGVTEYSQVDLTPSVEQLAVFYEKDLTLVTENEDGVVTVYAIGQKPANDYTIQVTITEVEV